MVQRLKEYEKYLNYEEKSKATVEKYINDVRSFLEWLNDNELCKTAVIRYKAVLANEYSVKSVNSKISSLRHYFDWLERPELKVKNLRIQQMVFAAPNRELTKSEYEQLVKTALKLGKDRLCLIIQTICSTGIRISELCFITVEALREGQAKILCKGKNRVIMLPIQLTELLEGYIQEKHIKSGPIFLTKKGNPINRSNLWAQMKWLAKKAGVLTSKVFPHNLRHLFAKTYYTVHKDIVRLSDILGHSSVNTTRLYTIESGEEHRSRIQKLNLVPIFLFQNTT